MIETHVLTVEQQTKLLAATTAQLVRLFLDPSCEKEFLALYQAQIQFAKLLGLEAISVDKALRQSLAMSGIVFPVNALTLPNERVTQPPDTPSSPLDLPSVGYVGQCDCGDVDCCDEEPEEEEPFEDAVWERIEAVERENVRLTERMNRLEGRVSTVRDMTANAVSSQRSRTDTIQKEVQHWHERITDLHNQLRQVESTITTNEEKTHRRLDTHSDLRVHHGNDLVALRQELIALQQSVKNLKEVMGIL